MRRLGILLAATCLTMGIVFSGCGKQAEEEKIQSLTLEENVLKVGTHIGYAPMEYYEKDGMTLTGFDMELAQLLAEELGMQLEIVPCAWDAIFHNLEEGEFDVVLSSVSYTKERDEKYALTDPYLQNGIVLVVPEESEIIDIIGLADGSVGVQLDTTADHLIRSYIKAGNNMELAQYENASNALDALVRGELSGVCMDSVVANFFLINNAGYKVVWHSKEKEPFCICTNKQNMDLQQKLNEALMTLREQGKLDELSMKYFGVKLLEVAE